MTSEERHEIRYLRRKAAREEKKKNSYSGFDDFNQVFSYHNLYQAYRACRRGVAWKASVQKYITLAPLNVAQTYNRLHDGTFKSSGFFEFNISERGKKRHIRSVTMGERVVQRCLCDNALVPMLKRSFIYDNGACLKHKGYSFTINRLCLHLRQHYRKYGTAGYILLFDFSKFFDSISHALLRQILQKNFTDERLLKLTQHFIDAFGDSGLGLGSQISQSLALTTANRLDHYIKEILRIHRYGRYMDDGYLIHPSKSHLQKCLKEITKICQELGITLNKKKTQIVKLSHGFTFMKVRFFLTQNGKVIKKINHYSVTRIRRKLKWMRRRLDLEKLSLEDIQATWQSWKSYASNFNAYRTVQNMTKLYNQLFILDRKLA